MNLLTVIRIQETTARIQETIARIQETIARIQETIARIQETTARIQETIARIQETIARIQETIARIQEPGFLTTPLKARACAGEQGSRGAGEQGRVQIPSSFPSAPLPLCPSALSNA